MWNTGVRARNITSMAYGDSVLYIIQQMRQRTVGEQHVLTRSASPSPSHTVYTGWDVTFLGVVMKRVVVQDEVSVDPPIAIVAEERLWR